MGLLSNLSIKFSKFSYIVSNEYIKIKQLLKNINKTFQENVTQLLH